MAARRAGRVGRQGLALTTLDAALERHEPVLLGERRLAGHELGGGGDLRTWSGA